MVPHKQRTDKSSTAVNTANAANAANAADADGESHTKANLPNAELEGVWGTPKAVVVEHGQTNAAQGAEASHQLQVPLSPSIRSAAPASNRPHEQEQRNLWDDMNKRVDMPDHAKDTLNNGDRGVARTETNPFKRKPIQTPSPSSRSAQGTLIEPSISLDPPAETFSPPQVDKHSEYDSNPWQPAVVEKNGSELVRMPPSLPEQDAGKDIWGVDSELKSESLVLIPSESTGNTKTAPSLGTAPVNTFEMSNLLDGVNAWKEEESGDKGKQPMTPGCNNRPDTIDDWSLVDRESILEPTIIKDNSQQSTLFDIDDNLLAKGNATHDAKDAVAPPSTLLEVPPPPPPPPRRPSPNDVNMSETYQVKNIYWHDANAVNNPRLSPILVQNANGPCPLVALVNALILTTPADRPQTQLVEILKSREQISLKFLLELVVDELMSFRHTDSNIPLPDMSELYTFLQGLHTGMNVNPRFLPTSEAGVADGRTSPSDVDIPGTFETTRDMELYATFSIPLIHGWLPAKDDPAYDALKARASSYDDAQNLLFREEELELKFSNSPTGLTEEEQQLYRDIIDIKIFLSATATQLTVAGLDVITNSIKPGGVSILFRNDHFSTLYRHPRTLRLFSLVTDAGYISHDEVVWESLVDVRGELAEFFSGDFRLVSSTHHEREENNRRRQSNSEADGGWQTVQNRRSHNYRKSEPAPSTSSRLSQHEQEDRDLALAIQLQEEEEERHRAELDARRRERHLSERFIEQQGRDGNQVGPQNRGGSISGPSRGSTHSAPPPRASSVNQPARIVTQSRLARPTQQVRSLIPPRTHRPDDGLEEAPPSYEQAAKSTPYLPPSGHPSHPDSSPRTLEPRRVIPTNQGSAGPSAPARSRQSITPVAAGGSSGGTGKDRDCCMM